jgi:uncharacterized protein DUF4232
MGLDQVEERTVTRTSDLPRVDDLIIEEARRRHRRRLLGVSAVVVVVLGLIGFGLATVLGTGVPQRSTGTTVSTRPPPAVSALSSCSVGQLAVTVAFNESGTDLGAIKLVNTSARPCSLSGQPKVGIVNGSGSVLGLDESPYQRAGLPSPPTQPIALLADRALPQAIVELDWTWCGTPPGPVQFTIQFPDWQHALTVPNTAVTPAGFVPAGCADSGGNPLLAVDDVRGFGQNGIVTAFLPHPPRRAAMV